MGGTLLATLQRGLDLAWLDAYPDAIRALTVEEVNQAIRERIDPASLVLVTTGTPPKP